MLCLGGAGISEADATHWAAGRVGPDGPELSPVPGFRRQSGRRSGKQKEGRPGVGVGGHCAPGEAREENP